MTIYSCAGNAHESVCCLHTTATIMYPWCRKKLAYPITDEKDFNGEDALVVFDRWNVSVATSTGSGVDIALIWRPSQITGRSRDFRLKQRICAESSQCGLVSDTNMKVNGNEKARPVRTSLFVDTIWVASLFAVS